MVLQECIMAQLAQLCAWQRPGAASPAVPVMKVRPTANLRCSAAVKVAQCYLHVLGNPGPSCN